MFTIEATATVVATFTEESWKAMNKPRTEKACRRDVSSRTERFCYEKLEPLWLCIKQPYGLVYAKILEMLAYRSHIGQLVAKSLSKIISHLLSYARRSWKHPGFLEVTLSTEEYSSSLHGAVRKRICSIWLPYTQELSLIHRKAL